MDNKHQILEEIIRLRRNQELLDVEIKKFAKDIKVGELENIEEFGKRLDNLTITLVQNQWVIKKIIYFIKKS